MFVPRSVRTPLSVLAKPSNERPRGDLGHECRDVLKASRATSEPQIQAGFESSVTDGHPVHSVNQPSSNSVPDVSVPHLEVERGSECKRGTSESIEPDIGKQDDAIVERSIDQRAADADEPVCVVCGRYGEYICDETDEDVCSLECKALVLERRSTCKTHKTTVQCSLSSACSERDPSTSKPRVFSSGDVSVSEDDFIIVRDGEMPVPEWEPDAVVKKLTETQVQYLRKEVSLAVRGDDIPNPILEFSHCNFMPKLLANINTAGYESPTPVQMQVIPAALKGRDVLVRSGTGTGKTVGYLLALVYRTCRLRAHILVDRLKPLAIVLTPTRELCVQVEEQAKVLGKGLPFKTALVVGGDAMPQQVHRLKQGIELIVATPGRLIDLLTKHDVDLDNVVTLVLDEVDCMLDRGFRDQVLQIKAALSQPQTLLFSATIPAEIQRMSSSLLKQPIQITVEKDSLPSKSVKQTLMWVENSNKKNKLFDILGSAQHFHPPLVVFVGSRKGADLLVDAIQTMTGLQAASVHGDKSMQDRREVMKLFLTGNLPLIVSTGILGRGLDLLRVTQVIIFDFPPSLEEYIHQVGRASRLGLSGSAMVFVNDESKLLFRPLIDMCRSAGIIVPKELAGSPYAASSYAAAYNSRKRKHHKKGN